MSLWAAVDGELHADDKTDTSNCRPIVHVEATITDYTVKFCCIKYWWISLKTTNPPK